MTTGAPIIRIAAGLIVEAEVFYIEASAPVTPAAEIDATVWIDRSGIAGLPLAPLTRDSLMPIARARESRRV